jgi:hypothetical protein
MKDLLPLLEATSIAQISGDTFEIALYYFARISQIDLTASTFPMYYTIAILSHLVQH